MLVFRELEKAYIQIKSNIENELDIKKLQALQEIIDYVKTFDWLSHQKTKEKVKFFIKSDYNYELTMAKFKIPRRNAIESSMSYASSRLECKIGKNTIKLVVNAKSEVTIDEAMFQFRSGTGSVKMTHLLPESLLGYLPKPERIHDMLLSFCKDELEFLKKHSNNTIKKEIDSLDKGKLTHLHYLIKNHDQDYVRYREPLFKYLQGEIKDVSDLVRQVENISVYAEPSNPGTSGEPFVFFEWFVKEIIETNTRRKKLEALWGMLKEYLNSVNPKEKELLDNLTKNKMKYQKVSEETGIPVEELRMFVTKHSQIFEQLLVSRGVDSNAFILNK